MTAQSDALPAIVAKRACAGIENWNAVEIMIDPDVELLKRCAASIVKFKEAKTVHVAIDPNSSMDGVSPQVQDPHTPTHYNKPSYSFDNSIPKVDQNEYTDERQAENN